MKLNRALFSERERALEDEFFRRVDEEFLRKLRAKTEVEEDRAVLVAATGITNRAVLEERQASHRQCCSP
jgi:hypothetical protein